MNERIPFLERHAARTAEKFEAVRNIAREARTTEVERKLLAREAYELALDNAALFAAASEAANNNQE